MVAVRRVLPIALGAAVLVAVGALALSGGGSSRKPAPKPRPGQPPPIDPDLAPADDGPPTLGTAGFFCCASPVTAPLAAKALQVKQRLLAGGLTLGMMVPFTSEGQQFGAFTTLHPKGGGGQGVVESVEIWKRG